MGWWVKALFTKPNNLFDLQDPCGKKRELNNYHKSPSDLHIHVTTSAHTHKIRKTKCNLNKENLFSK